jgi:hypothetical protein
LRTSEAITKYKRSYNEVKTTIVVSTGIAQFTYEIRASFLLIFSIQRESNKYANNYIPVIQMNVIPETENIFLSVSNATETISREEDVQIPNDELTAKQKQIDKMTLELLVNKRQYRKYLEKHNTAEYEEKENNFARFDKYKRQIGTLMQDLLNDYSVSGNSAHLGNTEIQDIFEAFIQKTTYFFESKEHETHSFGYHEDDPDTLFETLIDPEDDVTDEPPSISSSGLFPGSFANQFRQGNSFWGKNVVKRK